MRCQTIEAEEAEEGEALGEVEEVQEKEEPSWWLQLAVAPLAAAKHLDQ